LFSFCDAGRGNFFARGKKLIIVCAFNTEGKGIVGDDGGEEECPEKGDFDPFSYSLSGRIH